MASFKVCDLRLSLGILLLFYIAHVWLACHPGHKDTDLSEKGLRQAELAGIRLQTETFTHVFSSDLKRATKVSMQQYVLQDQTP